MFFFNNFSHFQEFHGIPLLLVFVHSLKELELTPKCINQMLFIVWDFCSIQFFLCTFLSTFSTPAEVPCLFESIFNRIDVKILLLVYKAPNGLGSKYIIFLLLYRPSRLLRSSGTLCPQHQNQTWSSSIQLLCSIRLKQTSRKLQECWSSQFF